MPIDNNATENVIPPLALGRKNWLFVGSQQAGEFYGQPASELPTLGKRAKGLGRFTVVDGNGRRFTTAVRDGSIVRLARVHIDPTTLR